MMMFRRFIPLITAIVIIGCGLIMLSFRTYVVPLLALTLFTCFCLFLYFFWISRISTIDRVLFFISSSLFVLSGMIFFVFLERAIAQYAFLFLTGIVVALYLENAHHFLFLTEQYRVSAISNVAGYLHVLTIFFGFVALYDARYFFGLPLGYFLGASSVFVFLASVTFLWSQKIDRNTLWWYSLALSWISTEVVFAISLLPHAPLVKGIVTTAMAYGMLQIIVLSLTGNATSRRIARVIATLGIIVIVTLATAQWV